jgi:hypothetical protein
MIHCQREIREFVAPPSPFTRNRTVAHRFVSRLRLFVLQRFNVHQVLSEHNLRHIQCVSINGPANIPYILFISSIRISTPATILSYVT